MPIHIAALLSCNWIITHFVAELFLDINSLLNKQFVNVFFFPFNSVHHFLYCVDAASVEIIPSMAFAFGACALHSY